MKRSKPKPLLRPWEISEEFSWNGRNLSPGVEISVRGERASRFRFLRHVRAEDGREWIDAVGGPKGVLVWRSFRPDRIKTVHRTKKTLTAQEARDLVNAKNRAKREERTPKEVEA